MTALTLDKPHALSINTGMSMFLPLSSILYPSSIPQFLSMIPSQTLIYIILPPPLPPPPPVYTLQENLTIN